MFCGNCGAQLPDHAAQCPYCGAGVNVNSQPAEQTAQGNPQADPSYSAYSDNQVQEIPGGTEKQKQKKGLNWKNILYALAAILFVKLFGPLETVLGALVAMLIEKTVGPRYPGEKWPTYLAYGLGIAVAFVTAILFGIMLARME